MSKIMLVSVSAGSGHVSAAKAIKDYLEEDGHTVLHVDLMSYSKKWFKQLYSEKYIDLVTNHPKIWSLIFKLTDRPVRKPIYKSRRWIEYKLHKSFFDELKQFNPDHVISTHFMPPEILRIFKKKNPQYTFSINVVVTDFDVHHMWLHKNIDHYFVAGELAQSKLLHYGIDKTNITISGIPIQSKFFKKLDKPALYTKWDLDPAKQIVLLMAGGAGIGKLDAIAKLILDDIPSIQVIALPGKNNDLLQKLKEISPALGSTLKVVGFTQEVNELMYLSDVVVTKPGGLSTSECITLSKPMLLIDPIPGQEEFNAKYVEELQIGKLTNQSDFMVDLQQILSNLHNYTENYKRIEKSTSTTKDCFINKYKT